MYDAMDDIYYKQTPLPEIEAMTNYKPDYSEITPGIWFYAYGSVYSLLDDGTIIRIALMDREEPNTYGYVRDNNCKHIVKLQNDHINKYLTPTQRIEAIIDIDKRLK